MFYETTYKIKIKIIYQPLENYTKSSKDVN